MVPQCISLQKELHPSNQWKMELHKVKFSVNISLRKVNQCESKIRGKWLCANVRKHVFNLAVCLRRMLLFLK